MDWAFKNKIQILTHANGEGASDMLIAAIGAATEKYGAADRRPVLIHGQFLREDQVDLSEDPTAVDPEALDQLRVKVTIKEDAVVYEAEGDEETAGHRGDFPAGATLAPGFEVLEALEDVSPTRRE